MRHVFVVALAAAFVCLSLVADMGSRGQRGVITGTVTEWRPGESIKVASDGFDPHFRIAVRDTVYEGSRNRIKTGVRVTVWYRHVGERLPVADRVRVFTDAIR